MTEADNIVWSMRIVGTKDSRQLDTEFFLRQFKLPKKKVKQPVSLAVKIYLIMWSNRILDLKVGLCIVSIPMNFGSAVSS